MSANVVVVGSANVDLIMRVPHLPAPGETVIGGSFSRSPGGKGANQAAAAAALGARAWVVAMVGDDEFGAWTRGDLANAGVDCSYVGVSTEPTGVAQIWVDDSGENAITVASGANATVSDAFVRDALARIDVERAVVLANLEIPIDAVLAAGEEAARRGWSFVLNPAPAAALPRSVLTCVDVLTPNREESAVLAPSIGALLESGVRAVVVTLGAEGADIHRADTPLRHQPAFPVDVLDTTGAGDAFSAALTWAIADGRELKEAVRLAAGTGALATRAVGARASLPSREDLETLLAT